MQLVILAAGMSIVRSYIFVFKRKLGDRRLKFHHNSVKILLYHRLNSSSCFRTGEVPKIEAMFPFCTVMEMFCSRS